VKRGGKVVPEPEKINGKSSEGCPWKKEAPEGGGE